MSEDDDRAQVCDVALAGAGNSLVWRQTGSSSCCDNDLTIRGRALAGTDPQLLAA